MKSSSNSNRTASPTRGSSRYWGRVIGVASLTLTFVSETPIPLRLVTSPRPLNRATDPNGCLLEVSRPATCPSPSQREYVSHVTFSAAFPIPARVRIESYNFMVVPIYCRTLYLRVQARGRSINWNIPSGYLLSCSPPPTTEVDFVWPCCQDGKANHPSSEPPVQPLIPGASPA
jgi:hypothetical protein